MVVMIYEGHTADNLISTEVPLCFQWVFSLLSFYKLCIPSASFFIIVIIYFYF